MVETTHLRLATLQMRQLYHSYALVRAPPAAHKRAPRLHTRAMLCNVRTPAGCVHALHPAHTLSRALTRSRGGARALAMRPPSRPNAPRA